MVELLESRRLLAASVIDVNGVPAVIGTRRDDRIEVFLYWDLAGSNTRVEVNGRLLEISDDLPRAIRVHGRGGDDFIEVFSGLFSDRTRTGVVDGGPGDDRIEISGGMFRAAAAGGAGNDHIRGYGALAGGLGNDTLVGTTEDDTLRGGPGDDHLTGWGGNDRLLGGPGNNEVIPGEPPDEAAASQPGQDSDNDVLGCDPSPLLA